MKFKMETNFTFSKWRCEFECFFNFSVSLSVSHRDPCLIENNRLLSAFLCNKAPHLWLALLILKSRTFLYVCCVFSVWLLNIVWSMCVHVHTGESVRMCHAVLWQVNAKLKSQKAASHQPVILDISQSAWYSKVPKTSSEDGCYTPQSLGDCAMSHFFSSLFFFA